MKKISVILFLFFIAISALPQKEVRFFTNNDSSLQLKIFDSISLIKYLEENYKTIFLMAFICQLQFIITWEKTRQAFYTTKKQGVLKSISANVINCYLKKLI